MTKSRSLFTYFVLPTIIVFGLMLRLHRIDSRSIWLDEKFSILHINGQNYTFPGMVQYDTPFTNQIYVDRWSNIDFVRVMNWNNANNFVHYSVLYLCTEWFGNSDFALRLPSLIAGIFLILVGYFFTLQLKGGSVLASIVAFFFAIHPFLVLYSQEARGYQIAILLSLASSSVLYKSIENSSISKKWLFLYFCLCLLLGLTHILFLGTLFAHGLYILLIKTTKQIQSYVIATIAIVTILLSFWTFVFTRGENFINEAIISKPLIWIDYIKKLVALSARVLSNVMSLEDTYYLPLIILLFIIVFIIRWVVRLDWRGYPDLLFLTLNIIVPLCIISIMSIITKSTFGLILRYVSNAIPYSIILFVLAISDRAFLRSNFIRVGLVLIFVFDSFIYLCKANATGYTDINIFNRGPNVYPKIAKNIEELYNASDTIRYGNLGDAQLMNLYFSDSKLIWQVVDTTLQDCILLKKFNTNDEILLFNFANTKLRY